MLIKDRISYDTSSQHLVYLTLCFVCLSYGGLFSQDYEPVNCDSLLPYKGAPLHDSINREVWENLSSDLSGQISGDFHKKLNTVIDELLELTNAPAITAAVGIPGKGIWSKSKGMALSDPETPIDSVSYFHWASVGKTFTATAIIQMVDEEKLKFTDPIAKWIPDFPNATVITIDHLLLHTSGTFSFNSDLPFREERGYKPPEELIEIAEKHGNAFCPEEYWAYSNTNYVLLGLILEKIEKKPLHQILTDRIIKPLGLNNTIALMPEQQPPGLVKGHTKEGVDEQFNESLPFGAGIIVSSAKDMVIFWHSLLTGKIIKPESAIDAFDDLYPMFDKGLYYGRGVMLYEVFDGEGKRVVWWLGHSGGTQGLKSIIAYDMSRNLYVAIALNNQSSAEASANRLLSETHAFLK